MKRVCPINMIFKYFHYPIIVMAFHMAHKDFDNIHHHPYCREQDND